MRRRARLVRLAERVAEARRPKRLGAASRLASQHTAAEPIDDPAGDSPAATATQDSRHPEGSAPSLPVSEEAARWLTRGEVPADLVPLIGDPALPASKPPTPERPTGLAQLADALERSGGNGQVIATIVEGAPTPVAGRSTGSPGEPSIAIGEPLPLLGEPPHLPGESTPLMRLARSPAAQELARRSNGELSEDELGMSTVTFAPPPSAVGSHAQKPDARQASQTPKASALDERLRDLDLDELYEWFLQRLRRDLLHDRERLGDLLGPLL
jgi:hypothetical protein